MYTTVFTHNVVWIRLIIYYKLFMDAINQATACHIDINLAKRKNPQLA